MQSVYLVRMDYCVHRKAQSTHVHVYRYRKIEQLNSLYKQMMTFFSRIKCYLGVSFLFFLAEEKGLLMWIAAHLVCSIIVKSLYSLSHIWMQHVCATQCRAVWRCNGHTLIPDILMLWWCNAPRRLSRCRVSLTLCACHRKGMRIFSLPGSNEAFEIHVMGLLGDV